MRQHLARQRADETSSRRDRPTIKLIGDTSQNISHIVQQLGCTCGTDNEFRNILQIYASKIHKLRSQRDELLKKCEKLQAIVQSKPENLQSYSPYHPDSNTTSYVDPDRKTNKYSNQSQSELNIFQLLYNEESLSKNKQGSRVFTELSQSEIQPLEDNESMLLSLRNNSSEEQEDKTLQPQAFNQSKNILESEMCVQKLVTFEAEKTPERPLFAEKKSLKSSSQGKSNPVKTFQDFLEDKICIKLSAQKYIQDAQQLGNKKNNRRTNQQLQNLKGSLSCLNSTNRMALEKKQGWHKKQPTISQFKLPLQEWANPNNVLK